MTVTAPSIADVAAPSLPRRRSFLLYLIKPSHYDDDGYVIQWMRSAIPSNSLAVLFGLASDCRERQVLGGRERQATQ